MVNFTAGGDEPASLFASRPASDELIATLPCLFPVAVWGKSFSLVSGDNTLERARSLPTLSYNDDYDETTPHLCYLKPTIHAIIPSVAQQGDIVEIRGANFGAKSPQQSVKKGALLGDACFVSIGTLDPCKSFASWTSTSIKFNLCNGAGFHLPVELVLGPNHTSSQTTSNSSELSYFVAAAAMDQPTLASLAFVGNGTLDMSIRAPLNTFDAVSKTRPWTPQDYTVEWAASAAGFPAECGSAPNHITVAALNDTSLDTLPLLNAAITDAKLFTLGTTRALRLSALKLDKGVPKRMCTEPILFDVAMPPAPPQNLSVALGKISDEGTEASFIVDFRTSPDFGGRPITACSYAIELVELSVNGTIVTQKTVPALPDAEQTELVTKMKPNTDYVAVVRTQCKVDPPAQGESGVLHGAESQNASFRVEPHREYAKQCAETGDFSTLVSKRCVPCPTEAEGAQCILGLLDIREGHWMPSVSLARAIETRDAKQTLFWKCKTSEACGSIAATIEDGPTAVPRSVCGVGFKGNLCGACDDGYGPLGDGCLLCPEWYVNFFMALGMALWVVINIGWQTYNTYSEARKRGKQAQAGIAESKTGSLIKILLDYCQLVACLAFIKIDPPPAVRSLFGVFALGSGVSANAMPVQCLLGWSALSQTWFYMATAYLAMFGPGFIAACYWYIRYVVSRFPTWWAVVEARAMWRWRSTLSQQAKAAGGTRQEQRTVSVPAAEGGRRLHAEEEQRRRRDGGGGGDFRLRQWKKEEEEEPEVQPPVHRRRRRSSLINTLTESVAESDVNGDVPGPVLQQLHRRFAEVVADPDGLATYAEFIKLVGAAAPSRDFVEDEWEDRKDENNTIGFDDFPRRDEEDRGPSDGCDCCDGDRRRGLLQLHESLDAARLDLHAERCDQ